MSYWSRGLSRISKVLIAALILTVAFTYQSIPSAFGDETDAQVAAAMGLSADEISSSSLGTSDHNGVEILTTPVGNFPTEGNSYVVLSSGCADDVLQPNDEENHSCELDKLNTSQGNDLVQFSLVLNVPAASASVSAAAVTSVAFDWKFYSDEFKEFVGSPFNDAFLAEKGSSTFTLSGADITAPNNVAFDQNGDLITINTSGNLAMTAAGASGTTYDGATPLLTTTTPIPEGSSKVTIIFSVFDMGDSIYDTTVLIDDVRFSTDDGGTTTKKATDLTCSVPETALVDSILGVSATLKDATTGEEIAGAKVDFSVLPSGPTGSSTTNSDGKATKSLNLNGLAPGSYVVMAAFGGNNAYQADSCESALDILPGGGENNPPVANGDSATTDEGTSVHVNVLPNDSDPDGDSLSVTGVTDPPNGSVVNNGDGTVTYTPDPGFTGTDEFEYTISDGNGGTDTAKVTVEVDEVSPPPPGSNYSLDLFENTNDPSDLVADQHQELRAVAGTDDDSVDQITFRWIHDTPEGEEIVSEVTVPIATSEHTFAPALPGNWIVEADFNNGEVVRKTLNIVFFVVSESAFGVIALVASALAVLGLYGRLNREQY